MSYILYGGGGITATTKTIFNSVEEGALSFGLADLVKKGNPCLLTIVPSSPPHHHPA